MDIVKTRFISKYFFAAYTCTVLSSCGNNVDKGAIANQSISSGEGLYKRTCLVCHQANGQGLPNTFPPLAKSDYLTDRSKAIRQVLKGSNGEMKVNGATYNNIMPPQPLSDDEIAAVLTYVYSNWGNTGIAFTAEEVKSERAK